MPQDSILSEIQSRGAFRSRDRIRKRDQIRRTTVSPTFYLTFTTVPRKSPMAVLPGNVLGNVAAPPFPLVCVKLG